MPGIRSWLVALVCAAAVGTTSAAAAAPPLTAGAYRAKANAVCTSFNAYAPPAKDTPAQQYTLELTQARDAQTALSKLEPPASMAALHAQVLSVLAQELTFYEGELTLLEAGKLTAAQFVSALTHSKVGHREDPLWRKLGVQVCARS